MNEKERAGRRHVGQTGSGAAIEVEDGPNDQQLYIGGIPTSLGERDKHDFPEYEQPMLRSLPDFIAIACLPLGFIFAGLGNEIISQVLGGIFLGRASMHLLMEESETPRWVRGVTMAIAYAALFVGASLISHDLLVLLGAIFLLLNLAWDRLIVTRFT